MLLVLIERNGIFDLVRQEIDFYRQPQLLQRGRDLAVELCHRLPAKLDHADGAGIGQDSDFVINKIKTNF